MRHGRKSESRRFDGFELHAAVTNSDEPVITAVEVGDASAHDGAEAKALIDQQPEELRPERIVDRTVLRLLNAKGYSLQANRKTREGASHPDRDAQFEHINETVKAAIAAGLPVISVDTKSGSWSAISRLSGVSLSPRAAQSRSAPTTSRTRIWGTRSPMASTT